MDRDERLYLKRLRRACPAAKINFPQGYYETDNEEEKTKEKNKIVDTFNHTRLDAKKPSDAQDVAGIRRMVMQKRPSTRQGLGEN